MSSKRVGLKFASEETYSSIALGIVHQMQEWSCYTNSEFVGVAREIGNQRGAVARDLSVRIVAAYELGHKFFTRRYTDYRVGPERSGQVWI